MSAGWPAVLSDGPVLLRPLRRADATEWSAVRTRNMEWLAPWEGRPPGTTATWPEWNSPAACRAMLRHQRLEARMGRAMQFGVFVSRRLAGQVGVHHITAGAELGGEAGYWIDRDFAGRGITPTALALVVDHCFNVAGLHRIEVNIRPENLASRRVVEKLRFRAEGTRQDLLFIDGAWRDHVSYALTASADLPSGVLARWKAESARHTG